MSPKGIMRNPTETNTCIRLVLGMCGARKFNNYRYPHDQWCINEYLLQLPAGKDAVVTQKRSFPPTNMIPLSYASERRVPR